MYPGWLPKWYMCGHMRKIYPFCIHCHMTQCDLLRSGIDNSSLHFLSQGTLKLYCNEKGTLLPYVILYTNWHKRKLTAHRISRRQKSYIKQLHHHQKGNKDVVTLLQTCKMCKFIFTRCLYPTRKLFFVHMHSCI